MKTYTKAEIIDLVRDNLIEKFGGLSHDENGNELEFPYAVLGVLNDSIPDDNA